ncbi:MAG: YxeA family protein [Bacillota bacterium]
MKKIIISVSVIAVLVIGFLIFIQNVNINRIGADEYFVQIKGEGEKLDVKAANGQHFEDYKYTLQAINKEGQEKMMTFTAQKQLRQEAFLRLYVKEEKGVTSWQEVTKDELPEKAKEKFE